MIFSSSTQAFIALYEEKSAVKAAQRLNTSRQTVSNKIKALQNELGGIQLFTKTSSGAYDSPTNDAHSLYKTLEKVHEKLRSWELSTNNFDPTKSSFELVISTIEIAEHTLMPYLYQLISQKAPKTRIIHRQLPSIPYKVIQDMGIIKDQLSTGEIDFIITPLFNTDDTAMASNSEIEENFSVSQLATGDYYSTEVSWREDVVCMVNTDTDIYDQINLDEYLSKKHILLATEHIDSYAKDPLKRNVAVFASSFSHLPAFIEKNKDLICSPPRTWAMSYGKRFNVRLVEMPEERKTPCAALSLIWHQRTHNSDAHKFYRNLIREASEAMRKDLQVG